MRTPTNIYVIKCREFYKIGVTNCVERRHKGIGILLPFDMELVLNFKPSLSKLDKYDKRREVRRIEKFLHHHFQMKRVKGEWFLLNEEDLSIIPSLIKQAMMKQVSKKEIVIEVGR